MTTATPLEQSILSAIKNMENHLVRDIFFHADDGIDYDIYKEYYSNNEVVRDFVERHNLVEFGPVDDFGGEGQGTTYYTIYEFVTGTGEKVYVKLDGSYCSYNGTTYERPILVEPQVVSVVTYKEK